MLVALWESWHKAEVEPLPQMGSFRTRLANLEIWISSSNFIVSL